MGFDTIEIDLVVTSISISLNEVNQKLRLKGTDNYKRIVQF